MQGVRDIPEEKWNSSFKKLTLPWVQDEVPGMLFGQTIVDVQRHNESPFPLLLILCLLLTYGAFCFVLFLF